MTSIFIFYKVFYIKIYGLVDELEIFGLLQVGTVWIFQNIGISRTGQVLNFSLLESLYEQLNSYLLQVYIYMP